MIARTWRGSVSSKDAVRYMEYMERTGLKEYRETEGNLGVLVLQRSNDNEENEFLLVSFWESINAIRRFAGEDYGTAVFYPEDNAFLTDRDLHVDHYEVVGDVPGAVG